MKIFNVSGHALALIASVLQSLSVDLIPPQLRSPENRGQMAAPPTRSIVLQKITAIDLFTQILITIALPQTQLILGIMPCHRWIQ